MTVLEKSALDALLAALFVNNTSGDIEANEVLARLRDLLDSYGNTAALASGQIPIKGVTDGVFTPSAVEQQATRVRTSMPLSGPGNDAFEIGPISAVSEGSTVSFFDRSRNLMFGAIVHDTTSGAVANRRGFYFRPADDFTLTDAVANTSETFTDTTHQFVINNANLGTAQEYRDVTRAAASSQITGCNLIIRRNSHTDPNPVFNYVDDVSGGTGFTLNGGAGQTTTTIDLGREHLFLAGEDLYVTITGDGATPLNLLGQTLSGEEVPHVDVWGRLGTIIFLEDFLGVPAQDGYVLSSTIAGARSWVPLVSTPATPSVHNLTLDIPSRVNIGTDLNVAHVATFDVSNFSQISSMEMVVTSGNNIAMTVPIRDGEQSQTLNFTGIDTSSATTVTYHIQFVHDGGTTNSNTYTVTVADAAANEQGYYGVRPTNDFDTVDVSLLTAVDVTQSGTMFDMSNISFPPQQFFGILLPNNRELVRLTNPNAPDPSSDIRGDFTTTANARTIDSLSYTLYTEQNLSSFTGTITLRATTE